MTYGVGWPPYARGRRGGGWDEDRAQRCRGWERDGGRARNKNDGQRLVHITDDVLAQKRMTNEGLFFILHRIVKSLRQKNIINNVRSPKSWRLCDLNCIHGTYYCKFNIGCGGARVLPGL